MDGERFPDVLRLQRHLLQKKSGDEVKFELGGHRTAVVKLAGLPDVSASDLMRKRFGLGVQPLTADLAEALGLSSTQGVLISDVQRGSPAAEAGLRRGVVITHVSGEEIGSLDRLAEQLADIKTGDAVRMVVVSSEHSPGLMLQQTGTVTLKAR